MGETADATKGGRGRQDVSRAVLSAALKETEEVGLAGASLRAIARSVGVSHQAITHYFPGRTSLFTALAIEGYEELSRLGRSAIATHDPDGPPESAVIALGETCIRFAREGRSRFGLMFGSRLVNADDVHLHASRVACWAMFEEAAAVASTRGWGMRIPASSRASATWATVHGLVMLEMAVPEGVSITGGIKQVLSEIGAALG